MMGNFSYLPLFLAVASLALGSAYGQNIILTENNDCSGGSKSEIRNCCTEDSPCDVGQGHCKANRGCKGDLVCGRKNCDISKFPWKKTRCCEVESGACPETHPFAFGKGEFCCATNKGFDGKEWTTNGQAAESQNCEDNNLVFCPAKPCRGTFAKNCADDEWECRNGAPRMCWPNWVRCNDVDDCFDGGDGISSDEIGCPS